MKLNLPLPPHLYILRATDALYAIVIRRQSKFVCTIGWNLEDDSFVLGQWMKGRIFEPNCDLSPDGKHFIYPGEKLGRAFTAISRAPYLKAIGFWPECYGGTFADNQTYWVLGRPSEPALSEPTGPNNRRYWLRDDPVPIWMPAFLKPQKEYPDFDEADSFFMGNERTRRQRRSIKIDYWGHPVEQSCGGSWVLRESGLENTRTGQHVDRSLWSNADFDRHRIFWTHAGKLFARKLHGDEIGDTIELYDFNPMEFEAIKAPY